RRLRGFALLGRPLLAAAVRPPRLDHEAVQMAAPATDSGRAAGRHDRALSVHFTGALRRRSVPALALAHLVGRAHLPLDHEGAASDVGYRPHPPAAAGRARAWRYQPHA